MAQTKRTKPNRTRRPSRSQRGLEPLARYRAKCHTAPKGLDVLIVGERGGKRPKSRRGDLVAKSRAARKSRKANR